MLDRTNKVKAYLWRFDSHELRDRAEALVKEYIHLLPAWVYELHVFYDPEETAMATVSVSPGDRTARIYISKSFAAESIEYQREVMLHEFVHISLGFLRHFCKITLMPLAAKSVDADLLEQLFHEANEGTACDIVRMLEQANKLGDQQCRTELHTETTNTK